MKKIIAIVIWLYCYLIILTTGVKAFEFVKDSNNPLKISYINGYTSQLQGHIFKKDGLYKGILTIKKPLDGFFSLGLIRSVDGINWQMEKEVLNTGMELSNARFFKTATGVNKLFVTRGDADGKYRIYSTDCDDDFNCGQTLTQVLSVDSTDSTEQNGFFAGFPYQQNDQIYLFYGVWGNDGFKVRLAYSDDLLIWNKCVNKSNLVSGGDGPFVFEQNSELYLFTHQSDSTGIKVAKTSLPLNCDSQFTNQGYLLTRSMSYDSRHIIFPSLIEDNSGLFLYYSGLGSDSVWRLNLAKQLVPTLTPSTTPTPTPSTIPTPTFTITPTPTLIPIPYILNPIVIIPGFMASWNKDAILFNREVEQSDWQILSFVKEYDGVIKTLENLGYVKNKDLFIFNYDWRKTVIDTVDDLDLFITSHYQLSTSHFDIVGHSLGGLIARIYQERNNNVNLKKIITAGSPHHGVTQVYKIVEAGEIDRSNSYLWLAVKMIINLNRNKIESDRLVINRLFPVLKNLLPTYNFLKKDDIEIDVNTMQIKNDLLFSEQNNFNLSSLVGEKGPTLKGFVVKEPTALDKILGIYPDGRPISSYNEVGDYLVLSDSARLNNPFVLNFDHGEIIYKKESIKKILDLLDINYFDNQIIEGKFTKLDHSLIFFIKSKGKMEVEFNKQKYVDQDGIIFIENAKNGNYRLKVKGSKKENDEVIVFRINKNNDSWEKLSKKNAPGQVNHYNIQY